MEKLLHAQVLQLERQLEQYVAIVNVQNRVLGDVHHLLERPPSAASLAEYAALRARVGDLLQHQPLPSKQQAEEELGEEAGGGGRTRRPGSNSSKQAASHAMPAEADRGGWNADGPPPLRSSHTLRPGSAGSQQRWQDIVEGAARSSNQALPAASPSLLTPASTDELIRTVSTDVGERLQTAVVRLLSIWFAHLSAKVSALLDEPASRFDTFHNAPTEDSLALFMDSFQQAAREIREVLTPAPPPASATTPHHHVSQASNNKLQQLGPAGNPFEIDGRLVQLFTATIGDGYKHIAAQVEAAVVQQQQAAASNAAAGRSDEMLVFPGQQQQPSQQQGSFQQQPRGRQPPPLILSAGAGGRLVGVNQQQQLPTVAAAETPQQQRLSTPQSRSSSAAGAATPRVASRQNDSSQIRMAMFGGGLGGGNMPLQNQQQHHSPQQQLHRCAAASGSASPPASAYDSELLVELRSGVNRIEMQLASVAAVGRDSGSESKYYALAKRLQKLRADLAKEQRACDEVRQVEDAKRVQRHEKEDHRKTFRR